MLIYNFVQRGTTYINILKFDSRVGADVFSLGKIGLDQQLFSNDRFCSSLSVEYQIDNTTFVDRSFSGHSKRGFVRTTYVVGVKSALET